MDKATNLIGMSFGRLTVYDRCYKLRKTRNVHWKCVCICGNKRLVAGAMLKSGSTKSCGCYARQITRETNTRHGMYGTIEYRAWSRMRHRCNSKNGINYASYGGRGISVCKQWDDFRNFYKDMGKRPDGMSLDRINNDKGYYPENCRWTTKKYQANNRRSNIWFMVDSRRWSLTAFCEEHRLNYKSIHAKLRTLKLL